MHKSGRHEKVALAIPEQVCLTRVTDRSLDEMLLGGDLDAVLSAHPPKSIEEGNPEVRRLFEDYPRVEREYAGRTGIFPIMHLIAIRGDVHAKHPWLANNLLTAFEQAKRHSIDQFREFTASRIAMPWLDQYWEESKKLLFDGDYWPYGVEGRATITP